MHGSQTNVASSYRNHRRDSDPITRQTRDSQANDSLDPDSTWVMVDEFDTGEGSASETGATGGYTAGTSDDGYSYSGGESSNTNVKEQTEKTNKQPKQCNAKQQRKKHKRKKRC